MLQNFPALNGPPLSSPAFKLLDHLTEHSSVGDARLAGAVHNFLAKAALFGHIPTHCPGVAVWLRGLVPTAVTTAMDTVRVVIWTDVFIPRQDHLFACLAWWCRTRYQVFICQGLAFTQCPARVMNAAVVATDRVEWSMAGTST